MSTAAILLACGLAVAVGVVVFFLARKKKISDLTRSVMNLLRKEGDSRKESLTSLREQRRAELARRVAATREVETRRLDNAVVRPVDVFADLDDDAE